MIDPGVVMQTGVGVVLVIVCKHLGTPALSLHAILVHRVSSPFTTAQVLQPSNQEVQVGSGVGVT